MLTANATTPNHEIALQRLYNVGFLSVSADTLPALLRQHAHLLVLLQSDATTHPEVADSWVIVPELVAQFAPGMITPAVADRQESEQLARQYQILKFPALLFFHHQRLSGSLTGLLPWQEYLAVVRNYVNAGYLHESIPLVQDLS